MSDKTSDKRILPCPFCGGEAKLMRFPKCERKYVVICENEQCMASVGNYSYSKEKAIKAWNTRKPLERIVERLEEQAEECRKYWQEFGDEDSFGGMNAYCAAVKIVKEEGGIK